MNARDPAVVVVGGGFFGCSIARMLAARGMRAVVVEGENSDPLTVALPVPLSSRTA